MLQRLIAGALVFGTIQVSAAVPKLIAHRGASADAPENTLAAFRLAWDEGADGIEGDFYLSRDGEVVCIHDATTKRTAGANFDVRKRPLAELRALDVGSWKGEKFRGERIPTLAEVLDVLPAGKWFFLEIKDTPRIVGPIARILAEKKADPRRVVIISFNKEVVKACRKQLPAFRTCWISELKNLKNRGRADAYLAEISSVRSQGLAFKADAPVSAEWLAQARGTEGLLMAWTVDEVAVARRVAALGVDFIGTNRPRDLRREMAGK